MKYILVIGLYYKIFKKKPAKITLEINEKFLDRFSLDQSYNEHYEGPSLLDEEVFKKAGRDFYLTDTNRYWKQLRHSPKFFKIYHIDAEQVKGSLKIKVDNANTDYTNGFMNKNSCINFKIIALFPDTFFRKGKSELMTTLVRIEDAGYKHLQRSNGYHDYDKRETFLYGQPGWPCVDHFFIKNNKQNHSKDQHAGHNQWAGGSFTVEIPIKIKHRIKYLCSSVHKGMGFFSTWRLESFMLAGMKPLLNTYNEDHGSNRKRTGHSGSHKCW